MSYGIGGAGSVPQAGTFVNPVAGTKLLMKRSDTQGKKPAAGDAEYGELFINYHSNSPMLCFKNNADAIVEIRPLTDVELALGELTDVDTTGQTAGMVLSYNGSTWVPVSAASIAIDVDLGYTPAADKGTVTNSAGDDAEIPLANSTNAGLMAPADKNKLDTYPNDSADLEVDLGYTPAADKGTVTNSNGTDAEIPLATGTNAGLMAPGDKNKIDGYPATPGDLAATLDLQAVTDNGNTTTNGATFGGGNIELNADGTAEFTSDVTLSGTGFLELPEGTTAERPATPNNGQVRYNSDDKLFEGYSDTQWVQILDETVVGTSPDQVPANQMLGQMAFIDNVATLRPFTTNLTTTLPVFVGECIMIWDPASNSLVYRYRDTATTYREATVAFGAQVAG